MDAREGRAGDARTDARLLADSTGDAEAFRVFYDRYRKRVYAFFERRTRDRDSSLDLVAETFARAWFARAAFRDLAGGSAGPWLFAIARRVLLATIKKRRLESDARIRLGLLSERVTIDPEPEPAWIDELETALASLPSGQRKAVELRVVDGLSYEDLAGGLGCSPCAARIRVSRGLSALRQALEGEAR